MKKILVVSLSLVPWAFPILAQPAGVPSRDYSIQAGDQILTRVYTPNFISVEDGTTKNCAPPGVDFVVDYVDGADITGHFLSRFLVGTDNLSLSLRSTIANLREPAKKTDGTKTMDTNGAVHDSGNKTEESDDLCGDGSPTVKSRRSYKITMTNLQNYGYRRSGFTFGPAIVPFKYHRRDHTFTGSASIGAFAGWRMDLPGIEMAPVVFSGFGAAPNANGGGNVALFSWGLGGVISLSPESRNPFTVGFFWGRDYGGNDAGYKYEGRPWLALNFGYAMK